MIRNAITVDVEDFFQVSAFEPYIERASWDQFAPRLEGNIERILGMFSDFGVQGTFFVLGCVAEKHKRVVCKIAESGHEIASHGYSHVKVNRQAPSEFARDVRMTKRLLEDLVGRRVCGYRAASFSIDERTPWAAEILEEEGYTYSSSIYPIHHDHYGMPNAPRFGFRLASGGLQEIPISTVVVGRQRFPCGGGGYFRLLPYWLSKGALKRVNHIDREPVVFYFHPWEIDPDQPVIRGLDLKTRFRHYINLDTMEHKLRRLLMDFQWSRMDKIFSCATCR